MQSFKDDPQSAHRTIIKDIWEEEEVEDTPVVVEEEDTLVVEEEVTPVVVVVEDIPTAVEEDTLVAVVEDTPTAEEDLLLEVSTRVPSTTVLERIPSIKHCLTMNYGNAHLVITYSQSTTHTTIDSQCMHKIPSGLLKNKRNGNF